MLLTLDLRGFSLEVERYVGLKAMSWAFFLTMDVARLRLEVDLEVVVSITTSR